MEWLDRMNRALDYIEEHLLDKMDYEQVARCACCSGYHFQRLFSFIAGLPLSDYVRRRKLSMAAFDLQNSSIKVVDLALKYGYDSPEAFTRAFQAQHGITPTAARRQGALVKSYPRISFQITIKGDTQMNYRIETKDAFQLYGLERDFSYNNCVSLIPQFWDEVMNNGEFERLMESTHAKDVTFYGLCGCPDSNNQGFPYLIGVPAAPGCDASGYRTVTVPASTWAVFTTEPHPVEDVTKAIQSLTSRVYTDWLPSSHYEKLDGYDVEVYLCDGTNCYEEVWIRVKAEK